MKRTSPLISIVRRTIFPYLLFGIILSSLVLVPFQVLSQFQAQKSEQASLTATIARSIEHYIETADTSIHYLSLIENTDHHHLKEFKDFYKHFDGITHINAQSKILGSSAQKPPQYNISQLLREVRYIKGYNIALSPPYINPKTDKLAINVLYKLPDRAEYLVGELNLIFLEQQIMEAISYSQQHNPLIFLSDRYGNLLIHPDTELIRRQSNWGNIELIRQIKRDGKDTSGFYRIRGTRYYCTALSIQGPEWILVKGIETAHLVGRIVRPVMLFILLVSLLFLGLLLVVESSLKRNVIYPLTFMFHSLERSVIEEMPKRIEESSSSISELETIRSAFNTLTDKIRERTQRLSQFERVVQEAGYAIYITDAQGIITYINPAFERITGYNWNDAVGKSPSLLSSGEMSDAYYHQLWERISTGKLWEESIINRRKNGALYHANQTIAPILDENEEVNSFVAIQNDVSPQREAERRVRESEILYRSLFENAADAILIMYPIRLKIGECNKAAQELLGYEKEELQRISLSDLQAPESSEEIERLSQLLGEEKRIDSSLTFLHRNGELRHVVASFNLLELGERTLILGMIHDVTEQRKAEEAIRISERKYRILAQNSTDMISQHDIEGTYLYASPACKRILGYSQEELVGRSAYDFFHPDDLKQIIESHKVVRSSDTDNGGVASASYRIRRKDGTYIWFETLSQQIYRLNEQGEKEELQGIIAISRDISERVRMEQALADAKEKAEEASKAKSSFLANMSHEIRTPLNAVLGYNELIQRKSTDSSIQEYSELVETSGRILLSLIGDILDFSRIEAGRLQLSYEPFSPRALGSDITSMFGLEAEKKEIRFQLIVEEEVPDLTVLDEARVRQILINLSGNAIKFTEQGAVRLIIRSDELPEEGQYRSLSFSVEDSGIGIPESQQENIFEAFRQNQGQSTRKYGGTGLGLAISKSLCEAMGGTISLSSKEGSGSRFTVLFPRVRCFQDAKEREREVKPESKSVGAKQRQEETEEGFKEGIGGNFREEWEQLGRTMILDEILTFAERIVSTGRIQENEKILRYGEELRSAAEDLDIKRLNQLFDSSQAPEDL